MAARLFSTTGYAATSTRLIAEAAGLRQASLFHYFAKKEDMLAELLDRTVKPGLNALALVNALDEPADQRLFTLTFLDTENLCSGEDNLGALQLLPEAKAERFDAYWTRRDELIGGYRELIAAGVDDQRFVVDDVDVACDLLVGLVESVVTTYERGTSRRPADMARAVTIAGMRALRVPERRLVRLERHHGALASGA